MKKRTFKKNSFFKRKFVQIARILGFELLDQANFNLAGSNKNLQNNLSSAGSESITIPLGKIKIKKKINKILIIFRSCTSELIMDQNKQRIFEKEKNEYTLRSLNSIIKSFNFAKKKIPHLNSELIILDTNSPKQDLNKIKELAKKSELNYTIKEIDVNNYKNQILSKVSSAKIANMASLNESFQLSKNLNNDLIFFLEDDYILSENCIYEMVVSYEKFYTIFQKDLILVPSDYPYLYTTNEKTEIFIGENNHWRLVYESLLTFMTSPELINKKMEELINMTCKWNDPFEKPLHEIYKENPCLSPIPSLSMHCTNINSIYGIPPLYKWEDEWNKSKIDN